MGINSKTRKRRAHYERREQEDLDLFSGITPRTSKFKTEILPGQHGARRRKLSEYGRQFRAKQLAKRMYGVLENQFRNYFKKASSKSGATGENLLRMLELRLDNIIYRLGFARTRGEARQLVSHKSVMLINSKGKRVVNIPSCQVCVNDEIVIRDKARSQIRIQESMELAKQRDLPEWLEVSFENFTGKIKRLPERDEMPLEIDELLIVELYSK